MSKLTIAEGGINWSWYVIIELHDKDRATILQRGRLHNQRDRHPKSDGSGRCLGDPNRVIRAIDIRWPDGQKQLVQVANPLPCFDYPDI